MKRDDELWDAIIETARNLPQPFTTRQINNILCTDGTVPRVTTSVIQVLASRGVFKTVGKANCRDRLYKLATPKQQPQPKLSATEAAWREFRSTIKV
jgi:hypothetical protein